MTFSMTTIRVVIIAAFLVGSARGYGVTTIAQTPEKQKEEEAIRTVNGQVPSCL
jgi:hypothetical protein